MLRIATLLILALLALPMVVLRQDVPLTSLQWQLVQNGAGLALGFALLAFIASELTGNYSQVDRLWSILPAVFAWYFAGASAWNARLVLMAVLVTAWGARLTFNFGRRGGYSWPPWTGLEDHRWAVLRAGPKMPQIQAPGRHG